MPIRLNLLAEAQAAEEERRRDPVKRALWCAALIIALMLAWSSFLQLRITLAHTEANRIEGQINSRTNEYQIVLGNNNKIADINRRLEALQKLSANRLLLGTLLGAMQKTTVDDVQLLRVKVDQSYVFAEGTKGSTNSQNVVNPGKPATQTEKILLTLDGIDSSANPGDAFYKYKDALTNNAYLKQVLVKTNGINLKTMSPPTIAPTSGKPSVNFTLECRYPDKTR
jgi:hypothetical protein